MLARLMFGGVQEFWMEHIAEQFFVRHLVSFLF
jgi:hypothetical protein